MDPDTVIRRIQVEAALVSDSALDTERLEENWACRELVTKGINQLEEKERSVMIQYGDFGSIHHLAVVWHVSDAMARRMRTLGLKKIKANVMRNFRFMAGKGVGSRE